MTITSRQNPLVKQLRQLHRAKGRREYDRFLIEGTHLLETACEVNCSLDTVCFTDAWGESHPQLREKAAKRAKRLEIVTPAVLAAIATTVHPDGVVATVSQARLKPQLPDLGLGLGLERLQDPGNLGTILRTSLAAGVDGLWLSHDSTDIESPKVLRASAGAGLRLPIANDIDLSATVSAAKGRGIQVIATTAVAARTYWQVDWNCPSLILLGNEGAGLSPELLALADQRVSIPVKSGMESLNVGIATALLVYEAVRQRHH